MMAHIAEGLSSAIILADRGRRGTPLHNIILTRGWALNLAALWTSAAVRAKHDTKHVEEFIGLFPALFRSLCAPANGEDVSMLHAYCRSMTFTCGQ